MPSALIICLASVLQCRKTRSSGLSVHLQVKCFQAVKSRGCCLKSSSSPWTAGTGILHILLGLLMIISGTNSWLLRWPLPNLVSVCPARRLSLLSCMRTLYTFFPWQRHSFWVVLKPPVLQAEDCREKGLTSIVLRVTGLL